MQPLRLLRGLAMYARSESERKIFAATASTRVCIRVRTYGGGGGATASGFFFASPPWFPSPSSSRRRSHVCPEKVGPSTASRLDHLIASRNRLQNQRLPPSYFSPPSTVRGFIHFVPVCEAFSFSAGAVHSCGSRTAGVSLPASSAMPFRVTRKLRARPRTGPRRKGGEEREAT